MLNLQPNLITIDSKQYDVNSIYQYFARGLTIQLDYYSGDKELLRFGSEEEVNRVLNKLNILSKND